MEAADTNVLVRYFVEDDAEQAARASAFLDRAASDGGVFVSSIVLCELVWVLLRSYKLPKVRVAELILELASADGMFLESDRDARRAVAVWEAGPGDFADFMIAEAALRRGCSSVVTFDRALYEQRGAPFREPQPA